METFTISTEDWREYRKNATEYLEKCSQYATRKAIQIAIDKQIPIKPVPIDYEKYMEVIDNAKFLRGGYWCPNCKHVIRSGSYCSDCGQAIDWQ